MSIPNCSWRSPLAGLIAAIALAGCTDEPTAPTGHELTPKGILGASFMAAPIGMGAPVTADESAAAETIARVLALAFSDPVLRQQVLRAMSTAGVKEGKLHLATFLNGGGSNIAAAGLTASGLSVLDLANAFRRVRDLEFYMPSQSHRAIWNAGEALVAAAIDEDQPPVAFDANGRRLLLDVKTPPTTPVLVITPVETQFGSSAPSPSQHATIPETQPTLGLMPSSPQFNSSVAEDPRVQGLYASFIRVLDAKEPWFRGDPELEIMIVGKSGTSNGRYREFQCAGQEAHYAPAQPGVRDTDYWYDQNGNFFEASPGPLLLSPSQMDAIKAWDPAGFFIQFWEDDDTACSTRERSAGEIWNDLQQVGSAIADRAIKNQPKTPLEVVVTLVWGAVEAGQNLLDLLIGGDDYIGVAVKKDKTQWSNDWPDNTHAILTRNGELAGRATIAMRMYTRSASLGGPSAVQAWETSTYSATASGTGNSPRYTWRITIGGGEANVVQDGSSPTLQYTNSGTGFRVTTSISDEWGHVGDALMNVGVSNSYPTAPTISGPYDIEPYSSCQWMVSYGSIQPSSFQWFVDDILQSESEIFWYAAGSSGFRIDLRVTDTNGQMWSDTRNVGVSYGAPRCSDVY